MANLTQSTDYVGNDSLIEYSSDEEDDISLMFEDDDDNDNFKDPPPTKNITKLTWNIASCATARNRATLVGLVNKLDISIIQLQEARLTREDVRGQTESNFKLHGYKRYISYAQEGTDDSPPRVGLLTFVKDTIPHKRFYHPKYKKNHYENICIKVKSSIGVIECQNVYYHHDLQAKIQPTPEKGDLDSQHLSHSGDTNARHPDFNDNCSNPLGNRVSKMLEESELVRLDPEGPTTTTIANNGLGSEIDMTLMTPDLASYSTLTILRDYVSDVHHPQYVEINAQTGLSKSDFVSRFKIETLDVDKFQKALDEEGLDIEHLGQHPEEYDLDEQAEKIEKMFLKAGKQSMEMTKWSISPWKSWYWNDEVKKATNTYNHWKKRNRKKNSKSLGLTRLQKINILKNYNLAAKRLQEVTDEAKKNAMRDLCLKITETIEVRKQWQLINSINNAGRPRERLAHWDSQKEADERNMSFVDRTKSNNLGKRVEDIMKGLAGRRDQFIRDAMFRPDPENDIPFTKHEQSTALDRLKNSAAGEDKVENIMLKNATDHAKNLTLNLINNSWNLGRLPKKWKIAKQVAIPKPDTRPVEFRPISLLPTISKVMEAMVTNRLYNTIRGKLEPSLIGFLKDRGTEDGIAALADHLSRHIYRKNNTTVDKKDTYPHPTVVAFIDFSKAFELADKRAILELLAKLGVRGKMLKWISDYLSNRKGFVTVNGKKSPVLEFENGVPQGSKISPLLFNVLINDLMGITWPDGVEAFSYADDIVLIYTGPKARQTMQKALDSLSEKCQDLGLKVNAKKTKVMWNDHRNMNKFNNYHNKLIDRAPKFTIGLEDDKKPIETVREFKYLGVQFSDKLNWGPRIKAIRKSALNKLNLLKIMSSKRHGVHTDILLKYVNTISNAVEYGALALNVGNITVSDRTLLDGLVPKAVKLALGVHNTTNSHEALIEAGKIPTSQRIIQYSVNKLAKILHNENESSKHPLLDKCKDTIAAVQDYYDLNDRCKLEWKRRIKPDRKFKDEHRNWAEQTYSQLEDLPLSCKLLETYPKPNPSYIPPIGKPHHHSTTFNIIPLSKKKSMLTPEETEAARELYSQIASNLQSSHDLTCYTDASVDPTSHRAGYAVVAYRQEESDPTLDSVVRVSDHSGSTNTELAAINRAIDTVIELREAEDVNSLLIVTDAQSGTDALTNSKNRNSKHWQSEIHTKLDSISLEDASFKCTILWVPSHIGIPGNEEADEAAARALQRVEVDEEVPVPFSLIKKTIKREITENWEPKIKLHYRMCNPRLKKANFPAKIPREILTTITQLRLSELDKCPWREKHKCSHCEEDFNAAHYFITCPVTGPKMKDLLEHLEPEDHARIPSMMAARILSVQNQRHYSELHPLMSKIAPKYFCDQHDQCRDMRLVREKGGRDTDRFAIYRSIPD